MKIETILDSYTNGNHEQMRERIQTYGVKKFFYDVLTHMMNEADISAVKQTLRYKRIYGIYYKFRR